ncbi:MAG: EamA family transporter [Streptosporangiaceae bacterium]|jgi:drug/metabolite transporter (DMT)-like permease
MAGSAKGGLTLTVAAAAAFGTSGTFATALLTAGWSPAAAVATRVAVAGLALTIPAVRAMRGRWGAFKTEWWRVVAYGLIAVAGCQLCYFNALRHLPVSIALLLEYLASVIVVGWLWLRHRQRPRRLTVTGGIMSLAGLAMMVGVSGTGGISLVGVLWGLLAAVCLAVYFTLSAADSQLPALVTAWGGMCVGALALFLLGATKVVSLRASFTDVTLLNHRVSWLVPILGVSLIAAAFAYVAGIAGAQRLGPRLASFASMAEVMFATLFAWIFLGQLPTPLQFAGGALIFAGVILVRAGEPSAVEVPQPEPVPAEHGSVVV